MKVAIDAQLALGTGTGIGEYVRGLADGLRARGIDIIMLQAQRLDPWRFDRRVMWDQLLLPLAAARSGADLLHCASGTMPLVVTRPTVVTVHDVAWFKTQGHARRYARTYFGPFSLARYRRARSIVVDSEFSRSELLAIMPAPHARVSVVYPGVADDYCKLVRAPDDPPFVLCVGTVERRKNLSIAIRALVSQPSAVKLIVAGPSTPYESECRALAEQLGVADRIVWRGYVAREALLDLFARAGVVVVPSRYEGFGYAAAQALCAGVPLLVSNCSSLPEVVESEVPALDPDDVQQWERSLAAIFADRSHAEKRAQSLRKGAIARFAWRTSVTRMLDVYESALLRQG